MKSTSSNATTTAQSTAHTHTYKHGKHSKRDKLRLSLYFVHDSYIFEEARRDHSRDETERERERSRENKREKSENRPESREKRIL